MKKFFTLISFLIFLIFTMKYNSVGATTMEFKNINLKNGAKIKYLYRCNIPIVYISVLISASPLDETKPSQAYLTAHMLTHGTKNRSARQIEDEIDFLAISIEKKVTYDFTILTLAATKRHLREATDLFFDILQNPTFPEEEFTKEVSILKKSIKQMEEDPSYIALKEFLKTLYGDHPYGRPIEGLSETVEKLKREDLEEFYHTYYKPNNMIFSIVGDINEKELKEIKEKFLDNWEGKALDRKITPPEFTLRNKPIEIKIRRDDLTQSTIVIGFEGISRKNPDFYAFTVMNYILGGGGLTSRLAKSIREEKGLAYSIYSTFTSYLFPGAFYIEVKTKAENTKKVVKLITEEIEKIYKQEVTEEELREAKSFLIGSLPLRVDTLKKISEFIPLLDFYELGDDYFTKYKNYIDKIDSKEILNIAEKFLTKNYILVIIGPE